MALRFVLDENQRGLLWRAIVRHNQLGVHPVDVVRVGDSPDLPLGASDQEILLWCEREDRIPGIFMLRRGGRVSQFMDQSALVAHASEAWEWADRGEFIP